MLDSQKLEIAIKALEEIRKIDGTGADLSPSGPCFDVANKALLSLANKKELRDWKRCHVCKQEVCKIDCCVREYREKRKKAADEIFDKIDRDYMRKLKRKKRSNRPRTPRCECEQGSNGTISGNDGRLEPAGGCPRHNEEWKRSRAVPQREHKLGCDEYHAHLAPRCCRDDCWCGKPRPNQFGEYASPYKPRKTKRA